MRNCSGQVNPMEQPGGLQESSRWSTDHRKPGHATNWHPEGVRDGIAVSCTPQGANRIL